MSARCRSCDAPIVWAKTEQGKRIPLDVAPVLRLAVDAGLFVIHAGEEARVLPRENGHLVARQSHSATCPNAAGHRRPRERG